MKKSLTLTGILATAILFSCNEAKKEENKPAENATISPAPIQTPEAEKKDSVVKINIKESDLASKQDPVCGMPAFKYMEDTTVYNGKIYAFCSKECKADFMKNPGEYVKNDVKETQKK